jgi:DNA polymerase V
MATPIFALADCNNFYVGGERGFRPSLVGRPVVVVSTTTAASSPAARRPKPSVSRWAIRTTSTTSN